MQWTLEELSVQSNRLSNGSPVKDNEVPRPPFTSCNPDLTLKGLMKTPMKKCAALLGAEKRSHVEALLLLSGSFFLLLQTQVI